MIAKLKSYDYQIKMILACLVYLLLVGAVMR